MPIDVLANDEGTLSLDEFVEIFRDRKYDAACQEAMIEAGPLLKRLSNNRSFLTDFIAEELWNGMSRQGSNSYSAQVVILRVISPDAFMRANFWPSVKDELYIKSGADTFLYEIPHDHNFNFLTVNYFGPGYSSDYYEYEYDRVAGYPGEQVDLRFTGRRTLGPGEVMLYRAHLDVHRQLPPESMSVTLNVMDGNPGIAFRDQYIFEDDLRAVKSVINRRCSPALFNAAASLGGEEARQKLLFLFETHDDGFARFHALKAAVETADADERDALLSRGTASADLCVAGWAAGYRARLES